MSSARDSGSERTIENAQRQAKQRLRLLDQAVVQHLDGETSLAIEVNGVPVGNVSCMDSALTELATGWIFIHRFCDAPTDFDRATLQGRRASVMIRGGIDILHRRGVLLGEHDEPPPIPEPWPRDEDWSIPEDVLLDILREAWVLFRKDRMLEGSVHAALASASGTEVVAFDITPLNAVAKVLGWSLLAKRFPSYEILVFNGMVTLPIVDAAARLGVKVIASPHAPTSDAFRAARIVEVSIVGYMRQEIVGLFGDSDVVILENPRDRDT